jgi:hypothetical protein
MVSQQVQVGSKVSVTCGPTTMRGVVVSNELLGLVASRRVLTIRVKGRTVWYKPQPTTSYGLPVGKPIRVVQTTGLCIYNSRVHPYSVRVLK